MKYLLPCKCGRNVVVGTAEAGLTITCECGAALSVPTLRHLSTLEPVAEEAKPAPRRSWGPWQAMVFLGLIVTVAAGGTVGYLLLFPPEPPQRPSTDALEALQPEDIESMSPVQSMAAWLLIRRGILQTDPQKMAEYQEQLTAYETHVADRRRWLVVVTAIAVAGLVGTAVAAVAAVRQRS